MFWTLDEFPYFYAFLQHNLGVAYTDRIAGERAENLERAIACQHEALRVQTFDVFPLDYADTSNDLGSIYRQRIMGGQDENLAQAITCYREALRIYTLEAFPRKSHEVRLNIAETEAQRGNWEAAQQAYMIALEAEDLLVALGTGTLGRDAILKEGREAATRLAYALHRLGRVSEAAVTIERGRARGLAEALAFDAADPALITDEALRQRYISVRAELVSAQAKLHASPSRELDENTRRRLDLDHTAAYRQAKAAFDALVTEIRAAHDPADFLNMSLNAETILNAATHVCRGHALVYLVATPWGGITVVALGEQEASPARFVSLAIPDLTNTFVNELIEVRLDDHSEKLLGGFAPAQMGKGFELLCQQWDGETFQEKVKLLHATCHSLQKNSTLNNAAQEALSCLPFAALAQQALTSLSREDYMLMQATFDAFFLQQELTYCLERLGTTVLSPVMAWLQEQGATSLTLIPCGQLATFPLTAVRLPDGRSVGETLPTSVAPSARSLLQSSTTSSRSPEAGITTFGDPHGNLDWSEAEARTVYTLARRASLPVEVYLKKQATRERLLTALSQRWIVNACCHGLFDTQDFLQSALLLANKERITMAEMLSHQADLRGLRLLQLAACQTAQLDLQAHDEVHSLAAAMLQAGARAVIAAQWVVDDKATYLLMVRFAQEWLPRMEYEPPAAALARAQSWLCSVTNQELAHWQSALPRSLGALPNDGQTLTQGTHRSWRYIPVRGRSARWKDDEAQLMIRYGAEQEEPTAQPYAHPYYWAGFHVLGW
ncbi:CHAT domain-containing protein [Dictyobacter kobayashii]|uniref:CHAT domain-containing protein n=1 Tax=Dictyobacter kobayashii TaxID=2014872 RepID=UPI001387250B|nr:CHAT domain-containing protein [Dictyobacter kobayashii]